MKAKEAENVQDDGANMTSEGCLGHREALQTPWGAPTETLAHQKSEVEGCRLNQHPFSNLLLPTNLDPAQPSGDQQVRKSPFQPLAALAQQPLPPVCRSRWLDPVQPGRG